MFFVRQAVRLAYDTVWQCRSMAATRMILVRCRFCVLCIFLLCLSGVHAEGSPKSNPAFGDKDNQVAVFFGASSRGGGVENLFLGGVRYSQPNEFFRLHGRRSMELMTARGGSGLKRYNQDLIFGLVQDAIFSLPGPLYTGINLGIYIKSEITDRIDSRFTFGEKIFLGVGIFDDIRLELYGRHFSNGSLATSSDGSQNFVGLSVMKNF